MDYPSILAMKGKLGFINIQPCSLRPDNGVSWLYKEELIDVDQCLNRQHPWVSNITISVFESNMPY